MGRPLVRLWCAATLALGSSCPKAPFIDIGAVFTLADLTWFEDEQTLFVFYRVEAQEGLGPDSTVELKFRTDDRDVVWTPLDQFTPVHRHVAATNCGPKQLCGSLSIRVEKAPRDLGLRLRYHRSGALALEAQALTHLISSGPAHLSRSLIVYGVFDETNQRVQWRSRNQFPTIANEQATELGLRRTFTVREASYGEVELPEGNAYGYGLSPICPPAFADLEWPALSTTVRAIFEPRPLPLAAASSGLVCARSIVTDAVGAFDAIAFARKNPQVRPAFPALRSPIREATRLGWTLRPCNRVISADHLEMQQQRFLLAGEPELCVNDVEEPALAERLSNAMRQRIDAQRVIGNDMVILLVVHHDDRTGALYRALERTLELVLLPERDKPSPRVAGALVYDSLEYALVQQQLVSLVLWCRGPRPRPPLNVNLGNCPIMPDLPGIALGPFSFSQLPVLSTRDEYLSFIDRYSKAQAGFMKKLTVRVPERSAVTENVTVNEFGLLTFFNDAVITAAPTDAFSFCPGAEEIATSTVVRPAGASASSFPLSLLAAAHIASPQPAYVLGLTWESPFLIRAQYESQVAVSATVASFTIPFGIASNDEAFFGAERWEKDSFPLAKAVTQCTRWCSHPTFDSSGQYQPYLPFTNRFYWEQCYSPSPPSPDDTSDLRDFPRDR